MLSAIMVNVVIPSVIMVNVVALLTPALSFSHNIFHNLI